jgi:ATP-dependent exoDNAse (exonuclease V) beta subunit
LANGLFLVGDGAQAVYKKGFSLKRSGISVANRSYVLKKNYRNSREILTAAYKLIQQYEFSDDDEDNVQKPTEPDFALRHGERPMIVKCRSLKKQAEFVAQEIRKLLQNQDGPTGLEDGTDPIALQICVIGTNKTSREEVARSLKEAGLDCATLREDASFETGAVKISTIESAKGHEFHVVFIVNLRENVIPRRGVTTGEMPREAARLYVAMTRARDQLYLCYSASAHEQPSQFLTVIQSDCQEMKYDDGQLKPIPADESELGEAREKPKPPGPGGRRNPPSVPPTRPASAGLCKNCGSQAERGKDHCWRRGNYLKLGMMDAYKNCTRELTPGLVLNGLCKNCGSQAERGKDHCWRCGNYLKLGMMDAYKSLTRAPS